MTGLTGFDRIGMEDINREVLKKYKGERVWKLKIQDFALLLSKEF
jgi:hypothetical protein